MHPREFPRSVRLLPVVLLGGYSFLALLPYALGTNEEIYPFSSFNLYRRPFADRTIYAVRVFGSDGARSELSPDPRKVTAVELAATSASVVVAYRAGLSPEEAYSSIAGRRPSGRAEFVLLSYDYLAGYDSSNVSVTSLKYPE